MHSEVKDQLIPNRAKKPHYPKATLLTFKNTFYS